MAGRGEVLPDVHEHQLDGEQQAHYQDGLDLRRFEPEGLPSREHIDQRHQSAQRESHPPYLEGFAVLQRRLDAYRESAPQQRYEYGEDAGQKSGGTGVDQPERGAVPGPQRLPESRGILAGSVFGRRLAKGTRFLRESGLRAMQEAIMVVEVGGDGRIRTAE